MFVVVLLLFQMQVTGKNLLNVCKLLFALSRVEQNDQHFTEVPITCEPLSIPAGKLPTTLKKYKARLVFGCCCYATRDWGEFMFFYLFACNEETTQQTLALSQACTHCVYYTLPVYLATIVAIATCSVTWKC